MTSKPPFVGRGTDCGTLCQVRYFGSVPAFYLHFKCPAYVDQISGFTALPGINNKMSQGLLDGIYWVPQMVCTYSEHESLVAE